jgi:hypothetical protein
MYFHNTNPLVANIFITLNKNWNKPFEKSKTFNSKIHISVFIVLEKLLTIKIF